MAGLSGATIGAIIGFSILGVLVICFVFTLILAFVYHIRKLRKQRIGGIVDEV